MLLKINLEFYEEKQEDLKSVEKEIIDIIKTNSKKNYKQIIESDKRLDVLKALSIIRENIINWYPFKSNTNILELNANFGEITEELCIKADNVVSIEKSKNKAEAIKKRLEEIENLEIIVGNIKNIKINQKFDYICINGIEEQEESLEEYLIFAKKYLKDDGIILFTCNNRFGLETWNCDNSENIYKKKNMSKKEIENTMQQLGIDNYKFYYPLPNYKLPNVIFTDKHLPSQESILRDFTLHDEKDILMFDEREKYKEIMKEDIDLFKFFANSYLVEISNNDNKIEFVSFGNSRKDEYKIKTIILEDIAYKKNVKREGKKHIDEIKENIDILKKANINMLDSYDEEKVYSKLIKNEKTFDKVLIKKSDEGKEEELINLINKFYIELKEKLYNEKEQLQNTVFEKYNIDIKQDKNKKLHYIKYGIFDLIFQNCFYIDNQFYFYDQEWREENIPIEFILYRSINYLANSRLEIDRNLLYEKFEIMEYIEEFEKLEEILQEKIKDNFIWKIHATNNTTVKNIYDTQIHYKNLKAIAEQELENEKESKKAEIEIREQKIKELKDELNYMKNSRSWKMTKIFRDLKKSMSNERKELKNDTKKEN